MASKLIFVTGASGFLASHIIYQLLQQGHRVRATARGKNVPALQELYKGHPVEIIEMADIAHTQLDESALSGVDALIHTASPLPGKVDGDELLKTAIDGSLNILRQAEKAGVKKFVVTSSISAVVGDPAAKSPTDLRPEYWNPVTKEDAASGNVWAVYAASKKYAELAVWEWAEQHPHVDVTTLTPPFIYGPFAPLWLPIPAGEFARFSTNMMLYNLLFHNGVHQPRPSHIDVRDVARAHVAAALADNANVKDDGKRKRIIFTSPNPFVFADIKADILRARPELEGRFIQTPPPVLNFERFDIDFGRIEEVLGIKKEDFHTRQETFLDGIDSILEVEKKWLAEGYVLPEKVPEMA
ncbi:NAD(P)-binding protein [Pholiota conissans]|uniref:NAD(P)-binding protein n=1 Tax=Pholiota conissans TaxID=109636 RepID=A0A9P5Z6B5_9AGAR|nr:NAD(P)-binding protein [Pholiota conissans]